MGNGLSASEVSANATGHNTVEPPFSFDETERLFVNKYPR